MLRSYKPLQSRQHGILHYKFKVATRTICLWYMLTLSLLKEPVILFLRELRVLFTLVPFSIFSERSSSSSFLVKEEEGNKIHPIEYRKYWHLLFFCQNLIIPFSMFTFTYIHSIV